MSIRGVMIAIGTEQDQQTDWIFTVFIVQAHKLNCSMVEKGV